MTSTASRNYCSIARRYEEEVLSGSIPACEFVKDAVRRNRQDLKTYKVSGSFVFNAAEGARVCRFIELPSSAGLGVYSFA